MGQAAALIHTLSPCKEHWKKADEERSLKPVYERKLFR